MIPPLPTQEIADRIARAARDADAYDRRRTAEAIARGELPPVPDAVLPPPVSVASADSAEPLVKGHPLDEAANMLPRARSKITVPAGTPEFLRPFKRNQGGFNFVLLEAMEQLVLANRQLQRQNRELRERVVSIHGWMNAAAQTSQLDHGWMHAADSQLRALDAGRLAALEARLAALEGERAPRPTEPS